MIAKLGLSVLVRRRGAILRRGPLAGKRDFAVRWRSLRMKIRPLSIVLIPLGIGDRAASEPISNVGLVRRNPAGGSKCIFRRIERNLVHLGMRLLKQFPNLFLHRTIVAFALDVQNDVSIWIDQIPIGPDIRMVGAPDRSL